jgi:hypothetical protein
MRRIGHGWSAIQATLAWADCKPLVRPPRPSILGQGRTLIGGRVDSPQIVCNAMTPGGRCGATARVLNAHYVYKPDMKDAGQVLVEAKYEVVCPTCGPRMQVEYFANA